MMLLRRTASRLAGDDAKAALKCLRWSVRQAWRDPGQVGSVRAALAAVSGVIFGPRRYLVFLPGAPYHDNFILGKILGHLQIRPTTNRARLSTGCPLMVFKNATAFDLALPVGLPATVRVINRRATDIRKSRVEEVFASVAGYSSFVDPLTWQGLAVEKSEQNAAHDGRVITCPIAAAKPGCVYQRLVQNVDDEGRAVDLRVPVIGGAIPLVYVKRRPAANRFSNTNEATDLVRPDAVLTAPEVGLLTQFAERFGLDFGELDVLRDAEDGRLYVVDVNNTPFGPPNGLAVAESVRAVRSMADAFQRAFLSAESLPKQRHAEPDTAPDAAKPAAGELGR